MGQVSLRALIVGDVHGDLERLFQALEPYPAADWRTIFLGDLVDYGMFGVGVLRFARDRPNSEVLLGNHEVALLAALRDPARVGFYISIGGQQHDLDELRRDEPLQQWMKALPLLLKLDDGTLAQHCGNDDYQLLLGEEKSDPVTTINTHGRLVLEAGDAHLLWDVMSGKGVFATQPERLDRWLELTGSRRVVFGHTPHHGSKPAHYHDGKAINYDGGLSRVHYRRVAPLAASVGPLPD
jgi:Calcineurin-like phosphoesterase